MKKLEQNIVLLGDSIFDNGAYVRSNEMDVPSQLTTLMGNYNEYRINIW